MKNLTATKNVIIYLWSDITLNTVIVVEDFQKFEIKSSSVSKITCSNQGAGICVKNSNNIVLSEIVLERCSMLQNSSTSKQDNPEESEPILCSLYVLNCTNLTLRGVTIRQSQGTGMVMYNTKGKVTVSESNFEKNVVEPEKLKYAGGGGLVVEP